MNRLAVTGMIPAIVLVAPASRAGDPTWADCIQANEESIRLQRGDQLREARERLLVCAARTCPGEVRAQCEQHLVDVNASIPTIVFEAKDVAGNDLSAVRVSMDGKPLADRLEGAAISIDPGSHSFHFESHGLPPVDKSFVLHQGEKERREPIAFGAPVPTQSASSWSPLRTVGLVTAGAGIVGLGIGSVFGAMAISDKGNARCDANGTCASGSLNNAYNHATASTVGFVAGGVLLATGVGVVLFAPSGSKASVEVAPAVSERNCGVVFGGAF
jgi:hypothetical protein